MFGLVSACLSATAGILLAKCVLYFSCNEGSMDGLAGVYTEFLMKKNADALYWQNLQLYGFGTIFNALRLTFDDAQSGFANGIWLKNGLLGYNYVVWLIGKLLNQGEQPINASTLIRSSLWAYVLVQSSTSPSLVFLSHGS